MTTLALNVADPLITGEIGKAAFDAVGPLLLIGWSEVGPDLLRTLSSIDQRGHGVSFPTTDSDTQPGLVKRKKHAGLAPHNGAEPCTPPTPRVRPVVLADELINRARQEDLRHRQEWQRPISADTLRLRLGIGSARARQLTKHVRQEFQVAAP